MYKLTLESKKRKFRDQEVYWYPLKITDDGQLVSINIATVRSYKKIKRSFSGIRVTSAYHLDKNNICFFYIGMQGDKSIFHEFGEKPFLIKDSKINYQFSDYEMGVIKHEFERSRSLRREDSTPMMIESLQKNLGENWIIGLNKISGIDRFSSKHISPNILLHLLNYIDGTKFEKNYYKDLYLFLVKFDFLVHWIDIDDLWDYDKNQILLSCRNISYGEIINEDDLRKAIKQITAELFYNFEIFKILYIASQYGDNRSTTRLLFKNLHALLPNDTKDYVNQGFYNFQPKMMIYKIELHFIKNFISKSKIKPLIKSLRNIFNSVKIYRVYTPRRGYRIRFLCTVEDSIDPSNLPGLIEMTGKAIQNILTQNNLPKYIEEMWVKSIGVKILTPPQFEDDALYSIGHNWLVNYENNKNYVDKELMVKVVHVVLLCDYLVFSSKGFQFGFDFSNQFLYTYYILNKLLKNKYNFSQDFIK